MKKYLLALAGMTGVVSAACAQSSVTLYGVLDIGVQNNRQFSAGDSQAAGAPRQASVTGVQSSYLIGNRWGVRGVEALGADHRVVYVLESGFDLDTGTAAQGGRLFGRQAYLGVSGPWGTVVAGRLSPPSSGVGDFNMFARIDPFGAAWGVNSLGTTFVAANVLRADNSLLYSSPTLAGFKFGAMWSANVNGQENAPQDYNDRMWDLGLSWSRGPFYVAVTYDQIALSQNPQPAATTTRGLPDQKMLQAGGTWDLKVVKFAAAYAKQDNLRILTPVNFSTNTTNTGTIALPAGIPNISGDAWMLGATVPLFGGDILGSYQQFDGDSQVNSATRATFEPDYDAWGLGYRYPLSQRTTLYLGYGQRSAKGTLNAAVVDRDQFAVGMAHRF
jgi:predicted porin